MDGGKLTHKRKLCLFMLQGVYSAGAGTSGGLAGGGYEQTPGAAHFLWWCLLLHHCLVHLLRTQTCGELEVLTLTHFTI